MKRVVLLVTLLALANVARAEEKTEAPILALDAGGHTALVNKVLFTPDGQELITVSDDKTIRTWDAATGDPQCVLRPPIGPGLEGKLYAAALSPDGKTLAVGGYLGNGTETPILLIGLESGCVLRLLKGHQDVIQGLSFSPDGKHLASASQDTTARVWDVKTGACLLTLKGHSRQVFGVCFAPDGRRLATASFDGTGRVWSASSGECLAVLRGHDKEVSCIAWSPDGSTLATGSHDQSVRLWSPDGTPGRRFAQLGCQISVLAFTPDSRRLLIDRGPGPAEICVLLELESGRETVRFTGHNNGVQDGALSPDGKLAATTGGDDNETFVWRTADGTQVARLVSKGKSCYSAAWSQDGHTIAWGNSNRSGELKASNPLERSFHLGELELGPAPDDTFHRAQFSRGALSLEKIDRTTVGVQRDDTTVRKLKLDSEYNRVRCFTLLPDDRAVVGGDSGLYLFDTRTGKRLRKFVGHMGIVWAVAPSPDNRFLLSACDDQVLRLWDPEHDEPLLSLFFAGNEWVAWTPQGYYAASPGGEQLMGWHVNDGPDQMASFYPAAQFHKTLYRPDVIQLVLRTGSVEGALEEADRLRGRTSEHTEVAQVLPPRVRITAPKPGVSFDSAEVSVSAVAESVGDHPITAMRVLLDGRPYEGQQGVRNITRDRSEADAKEVRQTWTVRLTPGKHRLAVVAESAVSKGTSDEVEVTCTEQQPDLPRLYVLAVGVSAYPGRLKLEYAAKDARDLAEAWKAHSGSLFRSVEVKVLTDAEATRKGVLDGLTWLRRQMTQHDVGVLCFSGHGATDADGSFYLAPVDIDPDDLLATGVPGDQLKKTLAGVPGRVLLLLDACHAGAVDGDNRKRKAALTDDLVRDLVTDDYGVVVMCASMGREFSLESAEQRQGFFTLAVLEGLAGKADANKDGVVTVTELDAYISERVKELSQGQQHPVTAKPTSVRSFPLAKP